MLEKVEEDTPITIFDSVTCTGIYLGGLDELQNVTDLLPCQTEIHPALGFEVRKTTLKEIANCFCHHGDIITVFVDNPKDTIVYQYNNYSDNSWYILGELAGYA